MSTEISPTSNKPLSVSNDNSAQVKRDRTKQVFQNLSGAGIEAIDSILWRLKAKLGTEATLVFGVTGCEKQSGASTIARALAARAGQQSGSPALLIDAVGHHQIRQTTKERGPGLNGILAGEIAPLECQVSTPYEYVDLIGRQTNAAFSSRMEDRFITEMLHEYATHYSTIVIDLPVANELKESLPLAKHLPGILLVVRSEDAKYSQSQQVVDQLTQDGVSIYGTVLNGYRNFVPQWLRKWF